MSTKRASSIRNKSRAKSISYAGGRLFISGENRNFSMSTNNPSFAQSSNDSDALLANRSNNDLLEKNCFGAQKPASHNPVKRAPRLHINVGGRHFEVARALLALHPTTRLGRSRSSSTGNTRRTPRSSSSSADDFSSPAPGRRWPPPPTWPPTRALRANSARDPPSTSRARQHCPPDAPQLLPHWQASHFRGHVHNKLCRRTRILEHRSGVRCTALSLYSARPLSRAIAKIDVNSKYCIVHVFNLLLVHVLKLYCKVV